MKKIILFIFILSLMALTKAMDQNQYVHLLLYKLVALELISFEKIKLAKTLPDLYKIKDDFLNFTLTCKVFQEISKEVFNQITKNKMTLKQYYFQRKKEIMNEIRKKLEDICFQHYRVIESFDWLNEINAQNDYGLTALSYVVCEGYKELVQLLIENGADINFQGSDGLTALHYASINGYIDIVELLIKNNANIDLTDSNGYSALHCATINDQKETIKLLIKNKANINIQDKEGWTALHYAYSHGYKDIAAFLIQDGIDVSIKNNQGYEALNYFNN